MSTPIINFTDSNSCVSAYNGAIKLNRVPSLEGNIYAGTALLTPELAKNLLKNQRLNRKVNRSRVSVYSQDMLNKKWHLTMQGIQLDNEGRMNDGQHRCHAVLETSNILGSAFNPPEVYFSMGFAPESMLVLDTGMKRSATEAATISGEFFRRGTDIEIKPAHGGVMAAMVTNWDTNPNPRQLSTSARVEGIQKFADPIEWVLTTLPDIRYFNNLAIRGLLAAAFYRFRNDRETLIKIDRFKNLFDSPYEPIYWTKRALNLPSNPINLNDPESNPLLLRHLMEQKKEVKSAGGSFRKEAARMAGEALTRYLENVPPGSPQFLAGASSTIYCVNLVESEPWNDGSWQRRLGL